MLGLTRKLANWHMTSIWRGYSKEASIFKGPILRRAQVPEPEYEDEGALEQATEMEAKRNKQQEEVVGSMPELTTDKVQVAIKLPLYMEGEHMRPVTAVEGARLEGNAEKERLNGDYHMYSYYDYTEMAMHFRNEKEKKKN